MIENCKNANLALKCDSKVLKYSKYSFRWFFNLAVHWHYEGVGFFWVLEPVSGRLVIKTIFAALGSNTANKRKHWFLKENVIPSSLKFSKNTQKSDLNSLSKQILAEKHTWSDNDERTWRYLPSIFLTLLPSSSWLICVPLPLTPSCDLFPVSFHSLFFQTHNDLCFWCCVCLL